MKLPRWIRITLSIIGILVLGGALTLWWLHEPKPEGKAGPEADQLARDMIAAVNKTAWDTTTYVQWTFKGVHTFLWDKKRHYCRVTWENNEVLLDINQKTGVVYQDGKQLEGSQAQQLIIKAWEFFCNDSFWLNAPVKAFDPGTQRYIVELDNGEKGLMVSYLSGGVTPGDSYLWILDEENKPKAWKMWVKIIPVGGMEFTWEKWTALNGGARIATFHKSSILDLDMSNLNAGNDLSIFGEATDPFAELQ